MSLKKKAIQGVAWNSSANILVQLLNALSYVYLARIVSVEAFGLLAFSLMIVEISNTFTNFGINQNLIQRQSWEQHYSSTAFWLMTALCTLVTSIIILTVAPLLSYFYSTDAGLVTASLSLTVLLNGLCLTHKAKLFRDFKNESLAKIQFTSSLLGNILTLALAFNGFGVWSLVYGKLAQTLISLLLIVPISRFKAGFHFNKEYARDILKFGKPLLYTAMIGAVSGKISNMYIGVLLGPVAFAFMSVAQKCFQIYQQIVIQPLNSILLPTLARVERKSTESVYYRTLRMSSLIILPTYLGIGIVSEELISILFGDKWLDSIVLMFIVSLAAPALLLGWYLPTVCIAVGEPNIALKLKIIVVIANLLLPLLGFYWGIEGIAFSIVVSNFVTLQYRYKLVGQVVKLSVIESFRIISPALMSSFLMCSAIYLSSMLIFGNYNFSFIVLLLLKIFIGIGVYFSSLFLFYKDDLKKTFSELRAIRSNV